MAGLSGVSAADRRRPGVNPQRRRRFAGTGAERRRLLGSRTLTVAQRAIPPIQQPLGGGQQPVAECRSGCVSQCAVNHFDHQDQSAVSHVRGKHDREMGEAFHRSGPESDAGADQIVFGRDANRVGKFS